MEVLDTGMRTFSRIFSLSFSGKKIVLQIGGMVCACIASLVILDLGGLFLSARLQPLVGILNSVVMILILFLTWGAISKVTVAEVAGLPAVEIKGAVRSMRKCVKPLVIAPLKIVVVILIMMFAHIVCGWIGRIPFVGEIVWPFLAIPLFLLTAVILAAELVLVCGTLLLPPIIMVGKESPVSELNDFLRSHTLRFIGYLIATALIVGIVLLFISFIVAQNVLLSHWAMGEKYGDIVACVPTRINAALDWVTGSLRFPLTRCPHTLLVQPGVCSPAGCDLRWTYSFAGFVWGVFTLLINLAILSLPGVILCVSGTLIYLGLKPEAVPRA